MEELCIVNFQLCAKPRDKQNVSLPYNERNERNLMSVITIRQGYLAHWPQFLQCYDYQLSAV